MPVFVDALIDYGHKPGLPHTLWCHMRADTLEELHEMAALIGLKREWFQDKPRAPHYDLTPESRLRALELGAISLSRREWVARFPIKGRSE